MANKRRVQEYMLYLGFSGAKAGAVMVDFDLAVKLEVGYPPEQPPACAVFEKFDKVPSQIHSTRSTAIKGLEVVAGEIVIKRWDQVPKSIDLMNNRSKHDERLVLLAQKTSVAVRIAGHRILALGIDVPNAPRDKKSRAKWEPLLLIEAGQVDLLVGPYGASSIWELQRFHQFADFSEAAKTVKWAVPLKGTILHLENLKHFLSPPGSSILILILPRVASEISVRVQTLLLSEEHDPARFDPSTVVLLSEDDEPQHDSSVYLIDSLKLYTVTIQFMFYTGLGAVALLGIVRAFWLVVYEVAGNSEASTKYMPGWMKRGVHRFAEEAQISNPLDHPSARNPFANRMKAQTPEASERARLIDTSSTPSTYATSYASKFDIA